MSPLLLLGAGAVLLLLLGSKSKDEPKVSMPGTWRPGGASPSTPASPAFTDEHVSMVNGRPTLNKAGFSLLLKKLADKNLTTCKYESVRDPKEGFYGMIDLSSGAQKPKCSGPDRKFRELFGEYFKAAGPSVTYLLYPRPQDTSQGEVMSLFVFDTKAAAALPKDNGMIYLGTPEELDAGGF